MVRRIPQSVAAWLAWVLAAIAGTALALAVGTAGLLPVGDEADVWTAEIVGATLIAFPGFVVLRFLVGRSTLLTAIWIPVTVVGWLAASVATGLSEQTLLSVGADSRLMPGGPIDFLDLVIGIEAITLAAFLGVGQGILLARIFVRRAAARLWLAANLVAAAVQWLVIVSRAGSDSNAQTELDLWLPPLLFAALYAALTGIALVAITRDGRQTAMAAPAIAPAPAAR